MMLRANNSTVYVRERLSLIDITRSFAFACMHTYTSVCGERIFLNTFISGLYVAHVVVLH